ncbi:DNA methyltransferase [Marinifilum fragile]|uniref:DNA methyltransferase n=1 Tax=Marinifilum fragile TaxID=570161 RepID=UPI002AABCF87|nr:DNA methyltransferase [Marinifilum fragile]
MDKSLLSFESREELIEYFIKEYSLNEQPITVSFRELFPELNRIDRYSHLIHTYPAKLLVHIPYFFLNNSFFTRAGDNVLDPFCGTGTVLLESMLAGRNAIGADANPLARLISKVKTKRLQVGQLRISLIRILEVARVVNRTEIPNVVNRDYWFSENIQRDLGRIQYAIAELTECEEQDFFNVCFSNCIKKVSYADQNISVPVKINPHRFEVGSDRRLQAEKKLMDLELIDVFAKFETVCQENIRRISRLEELDSNVDCQIVSSDARKLTRCINQSELLQDESVDFILTSPPYAGAQKYIRSSSLNLGWLELTGDGGLTSLDRQNIGRENYRASELQKIKTGIPSADTLLEEIFEINFKRAFIVANYLNEMKAALSESWRVLKSESYMVIVIGNNKVCGQEFNTQEYITEYLEQIGAELKFKLIDDIKSYGLMTKRNKTADIISREWVLVFKKNNNA